MYPENTQTVLRNQTVWSNLPWEIYPIEAIDKIPDDCTYPFSVIQAAQNQK